ncbi:Threonine/homoserine efflux transporter RhtA [Franzmannia pantelleriensis]|uniref:Threonine/homoserine efflux transporter RhtA n=1 Tax=Franzmannia pantelleriensis TaxID=48727 RepID=A0A1G9G6P4_9GAMM|nr:DMT family transporter [Halomonas pantelleriensis]SDK96271.1 Threonine/homoserine efflux transporter RhtA [Halomonas pantelleriensis]
MPATDPSAALLPRHLAIVLLLSVACLFAANHVAARLAFDDGTGLLLAIMARSSLALVVLGTLLVIKRTPLRLPAGSWPWQLGVGLLITLQSVFLYSAVARLPVAVALLLMNTFPIILALLTWALGGARPTLRATLIMAVILIGLVVVLDVPTWLADPAQMGDDWVTGVAFGIGAATVFSCALWITDRRLARVSNTLRTFLTMGVVLLSMLVAGVAGLVPGGLALPATVSGWSGLTALALLYGIGFSILFVSLPRLNMARNAPVMNIEPVASLVLGYIVLGQMLGPMQLLGGAIVLGGIVVLGLSRRA